MDVNKVLYVSQVVDPYLPESRMGVFSRLLPQAVQEHGAEVRTFLPKYGSINERRNQLHEVIRLSGINIPINDTDHPLLIKVATLQPSRLQFYFIDSDDFFMRRSGGKIETEHDAANNDERCIFFVRGTAETVRKLRWQPSIVHCIGWMSALAPLYFKTIFSGNAGFRNTKVVYSLFNAPMAGTLNAAMVDKLRADGIGDDELKALSEGGTPVDDIKLNKSAIDHADAITISSDDVPDELTAYAKASGKPVLSYPGDDYRAYIDFYKSL